ncbi:MAG TPA: trypsin-like serine protease [Kofleriaceae bacterium]|nr:trypsin-like serine protease [Kofleriaceae bacterium]
MKVLPRRVVLVLAAAISLGGGRVAASPSGDDADPPDLEQPQVVGGQLEPGYPSAGFLLISSTRDGDYSAPACGLTLVAPRAVVTAAHCVAYTPEALDEHYAVGFGVIDATAEANIVGVTEIVVHPGYVPDGDPRYRHDVAVLILDRDMTELAPELPVMSLGPALSIGQDLTYVGYGRTTPGGVEEAWVGGERKSAGQQVEWDDGFSYGTVGSGGGLCWGDSGGPLLSDAAVYGVLADFDQVFDCQVENAMVFTKLDAERSFIDGALADAASAPAPTEIAAVTDWVASPDGGGSYTIEWQPVRYAASLAAPVVDLTLEGGETIEVTIELENAGNMAWIPGKTSIATDPAGRESEFANDTWTSPTVAASVTAQTRPQAVGTYTFTVTAPEVDTDTLYREGFVLAHDGATAETVEAVDLDIIVTGPPDGGGGCGCGAGRGTGGWPTLFLLVGVLLVLRRR